MLRRLVEFSFLVLTLTVITSCASRIVGLQNSNANRQGLKEAHNQQDPQALVKSIKLSDFATAKQLLADGANPDERGSSTFTPLMIAVQRSDRKIIELLLASGANVNAANDSGSTALMEAVRTGDPEVVKILLDKGADLSAKEHYYGTTALHIAAQVAGANIMKALLAKSGNPDVRDNDDTTPLMIAAGNSVDNVKEADSTHKCNFPT